MSREPSLFAAMDAVAMRLRKQPDSTRASPATWGEAASQSEDRCFVEADLQIEFRQLQRYYWPELDDIGKDEWLDLFEVWRDHDRARLTSKMNDMRATLGLAERERCALIRELHSRRQQGEPDESLHGIEDRIEKLARLIASAY